MPAKPRRPCTGPMQSDGGGRNRTTLHVGSKPLAPQGPPAQIPPHPSATGLTLNPSRLLTNFNSGGYHCQTPQAS